MTGTSERLSAWTVTARLAGVAPKVVVHVRPVAMGRWPRLAA